MVYCHCEKMTSEAIAGVILRWLSFCPSEVTAMPRRPNIPCKHPGCSQLVPYGTRYCEEHRPLHVRDRKTAVERGYGYRWQKARAAYLCAHPLCVRCRAEGKLVPATVVDHIIPHRGDKKLFWDTTNWQALCKRCHDRKTMTEDRYQEFHY